MKLSNQNEQMTWNNLAGFEFHKKGECHCDLQLYFADLHQTENTSKEPGRSPATVEDKCVENTQRK